MMEPKEEYTKPSNGKGNDLDYLRKIGNTISLSEQPDAPPRDEFKPPHVAKLSDIRMELMRAPSGGVIEPPKPTRAFGGLKRSRIIALLCAAGFLIFITFLFSNGDSPSNPKRIEPRQGDLSKSGGTATVREPYVPKEDDPNTSNDESNDQPVGHFGTLTLQVTNAHNGNTYTLDVELDGTEVARFYFPKGGWVDFDSCELDEDFQGECEDEQGRTWLFEGEN